ncbi:hypothetical protein SR882_10075 [Guyparkeria halophila]|uniref:PepSY domain-containing protein n=1 Tax=Guyparkeria halophila TaxID=47960 RepID=A0ABZ0YXS4_9GAMM|nr:PepSY domain-containing protein [Guyparkeria halophila]WQH16097.1 hypothetical protein SR882_10075 [Guyparkeria halophila]
MTRRDARFPKRLAPWMLLVPVATVMFAGPVAVSPARADHNQVLELHQQGRIISLVELLERAQAIHPGQMVEARLDEDSLVYEITVYGEDDHYHEMYFDARDGRLLSEHEEDEESFHDDDHHEDHYRDD